MPAPPMRRVVAGEAARRRTGVAAFATANPPAVLAAAAVMDRVVEDLRAAGAVAASVIASRTVPAATTGAAMAWEVPETTSFVARSMALPVASVTAAAVAFAVASGWNSATWGLVADAVGSDLLFGATDAAAWVGVVAAFDRDVPAVGGAFAAFAGAFRALVARAGAATASVFFGAATLRATRTPVFTFGGSILTLSSAVTSFARSWATARFCDWSCARMKEVTSG